MASRRTIVVKFVLENFKSYAGVREIGPMHKRFLAVVGPNGSGKSNLIDALLFIFGKRAKKLRMKNLSSLIHNSAEHPNAKEARVEIHFCEVDDQDPVTMSEDTDEYNVLPGSEFILARTVKQDNTTYYTLNGKRQSFDDVEVFMKTKGIDINNNRFLILQGEVEAISLMKPKGETKHEEGMLEFLEELIGTDRFVEEIEQKQQLVETLGQNRAVCLEQVKIGEKEMASLEGPKDDAMRLRALEILILDKQYQILHTRTRQSGARCDEASQTVQALNEQFAGTRAQLDEQKQAMAVLQAEYDQKQTTHQQLAKEQQECKQEWEKFERKDIKERTKAKQYEAKVDKLNSSLEQARKSRLGEEEKQFELEGAIPGLTAQVDQHQQALVNAESALEQMFLDNREESRAVRDLVGKKQQELAPFAATLSQAESQVTLLERELELLRHPVLEAKQKLIAATEELASANETRTTAPQRLLTAEHERTQLTKELTGNKQTVSELREREGELESEIELTQSTLKQVAAVSSSTGPVLQRLMGAKKPGGELAGCGLFGRLGDLGKIADELDCAATTAAGSSLNSFVTQTTEDAERCVGFLRQHNLGVSTFIILDKMPAPDMGETFPAPRLFDRIEPVDSKFLPAFYYALRDTLVCPNLDQAMQVAYDAGTNQCKHRVVTLKGELIDNSGTMSGGGKPKRGGFSSNPVSLNDVGLSPEQVREAETKLAQLSQALSALRGEIAQLVGKIAAQERALLKQEDVVDQLRRGAETAEQKYTLLQSRLAELSQAAELNQGQLAQEQRLVEQLAHCKPEREHARNNADKFTQELEQLNTQLRKVGGARAEQCHQQVEQCRDKLDKTRALLTKSQVQLEASQANLSKFERAVEQCGEALEVALAEQANHEQDMLKMEERALEIAERIQIASSTLQQVVGELERTKREYYVCKDKLNAVENSNVDMKLQLQTADEEVKKCQARKAKWQAELEQARRNLADWKKDEEEQESIVEEAAEQEELDDHALHRLENDVLRAEAEAKSLRGNVNMGAIAEFKTREREYLVRVSELDQASAMRDHARLECDELKKQRLIEFMAGFSVISLKLKEIYQLITLGGDAELELVDSLDPFSEGVVFSVRPPKKSWKNISNLSGGEKTLSSLSLVFALHAFRGAPIYVMDEIDAALDFKNVSIVANYIKERTKNAQFLIISLRNNMFELADRLVGVYKTNNATKSVTIDPKKVALKSGIVSSSMDDPATPARPVLSERNH